MYSRLTHIMDDVVKIVLEHHVGEIVLLIYVHGCMLLLVHRLGRFRHWRHVLLLSQRRGKRVRKPTGAELERGCRIQFDDPRLKSGVKHLCRSVSLPQ